MFRVGALMCEKWICSHTLQKPVKNLLQTPFYLPQNIEIVRSTSFFNKVDAEGLWKAVTTVSNAGKKRGRGKGGDKRMRKNLNFGQRIGIGKNSMVWPGLTCHIIQGSTLVDIQKLPEESKTPTAVQPSLKKQTVKVHPLERGWTARSIKGKNIGPPDPIEDVTYENFMCVPIESRLTLNMTSLFGKKRNFILTVLTGNRNGLIGMGHANRLDSKAALRLAKNRAIKRLIAIDLIDPTSVNHDFFCSFGNTRIFVYKKPEGYGLKCQRVLRVCCELIGIKNMYAKIEGAMNYRNIVKAFLLGLLRQKTYQQIADEKKLHLVEFRKERLDFPEVLASPQTCLTELEAKKDHIGFDEYIMGNKVVYKRPKKVPFYQRLPSWNIYLKTNEYKRNHFKVKLNLLAEYGDYKSYLTNYYPECRSPGYGSKKKSA